ncbi:hypothetical protein [Paenibacillus barengoltzii]|uniref:hypothetical protein n=1 Tax=Paenibacillus barengoltzii TaxID=343517 RepID=UPI0013E06BC3|nr:hypothetical protein [Paenibacillus barengoltzii]
MASIQSLTLEVKKHLESEEKLICVAFGSYTGKSLGQEAIRSGVFAATNKRVIFYGKSLQDMKWKSFRIQQSVRLKLAKAFLLVIQLRFLLLEIRQL